MKKLIKLRAALKQQAGISLIASALMIIALGMILTLAARFYTVWDIHQTEVSTNEGMAVVQSALEKYMMAHGRYPCPAPLDSGPDSGTFGVAAADCNQASVAPGTFRSAGRDGRNVRTGSVPVRTLELPDELIADAYGHRYIYAVTEEYADAANLPPQGDNGAIFVRDPSGNPATSTDGNLVNIVYSMGWDNNGAYSLAGNLISACDTGAASGENCNFDSDAVFINTVNKSQNETDPFVTKISYNTSKIVNSCVEESSAPPRHVSFLVDTSGSMRSNVNNCPETIADRRGRCRRIDVAHWAIRRLIPARINANSRITSSDMSAGITVLGGFRGSDTIDDPEAAGYTPPELDDVSDDVEDQLAAMCPQGDTPLGDHINSMAVNMESMGNSHGETQADKIVVVSDGLRNRGRDPVAVARDLASRYPNLQIDMIDVTGANTDAQEISELTGGNYYNPDSADEFLEDLYHAAGVCGPLDNPPEPTDHIYCP